MSGGYFDHKQYQMEIIADDIEHVIKNNDVTNDYGYTYTFSDETIAKFKETIELLRKGYNMVHRIDYLLSGDDGEDDFNNRWKNEGL